MGDEETRPSTPATGGGSGAPTATVEAGGNFSGYPLPQGIYDEVFDASGRVRPAYRRLVQHLASLSGEELAAKSEALELSLRAQGITFTVYSGAGSAASSEGVERTFPIDLVPRIVAAAEWENLKAGLIQRTKALNAFLGDLYSGQQVLHDGIVPTELVVTGKHFTRQATGLEVPGGVWTHVSGTDLIRGTEGQWMVLEDNCRTPSGVSYVLENRASMTRGFPELFFRHRVQSVDHYPQALLKVLRSVAPRDTVDPTVVVLTPGSFNSAYFEHTFLARQMGVEIVEGGDLFVDEAVVYMMTTRGPRRVDVIYRRIDDDFLDPLQFRADSVLGVPGLMTAMRARNVAVANAVGTGIADDKAIFAYVPALIDYYLGEEMLLEQIPTYLPDQPGQLEMVLDRLPELVVKSVSESGGYGMTIGPMASAAEIDDCRRRVRAKPRAYIAQETIRFSTHPTRVEDGFRPRHVDLRPFVLMGADGFEVVPGGLSRVALPEGSLVVNSSQGGGSKDTWVLADDEAPAPTTGLES